MMRNLKLMCIAFSVIAIAACGNGKGSGNTQPEATNLVNAAYQARDYERLLRTADSLQRAGQMAEADAYYWKGYASDRMRRQRMAELYWKAAMTETENSTTADDLAIYVKSATRLANLLSVRGEFEAALKVAQPAAERLEALGCDTTSDYTNLLIYIGCCQSRFGLSQEQADANFERAYQMHLKNIERHHSDEAYKNAIAGLINIAYNCNETHLYDTALKWIDRFGQLVSQYELRDDANTSYVDKQWSRYDIYRAVALEGMCRSEEAAQVYDEYQKTKFGQTSEGHIVGNDYLLAAGRWEEAADNYASLDNLFSEFEESYSLEHLQQAALKKYHANLMAGRTDSAIAVSMAICERLDSAIAQARRMDTEEQTLIREEEAELAQQQADSASQRTTLLLAALALAALVFIAYTLYQRRAQQKLKRENDKLKQAHAQIEKDTLTKERRESELRIAHDIQMSLIPKKFPDTDEVSIFATLKPAKTVGGDLYDFHIRDGQLFFCIGDANGNGLSASLAMAMTKVHFRTVSAHISQPESIVAAINQTMTKADDKGMTLTLFVGVLDLATGRLNYCNAGHEAPLLVGSGVGLLPVDSNKAVGQDAKWKYTAQQTLIDPGTSIFLYTDGLPMAINKDGQQFGTQRMKGEALQAIKGLDPAPTAFIERMGNAVLRFTGDTEQSDDVTMMDIRYTKKADGLTYQRSISLASDTDELPKLTQFADEVSTAMHFDEKTATDINSRLEEAVTNTIGQGDKSDVHIEAQATQSAIRFVIHHGEDEATLTWPL